MNKKQVHVIIKDSRGETTDRYNIEPKRFKYETTYRSKMIMSISTKIGKSVNKELE